MVLDDPLETAALKVASKDSCPVWMLEDFYTNHWDFETLCSRFSCKECVADPEDLGPTEPWVPDAGSLSDDVAF